MKKYIYPLLLLVFIVLFSYGCKKEGDTNKPFIVILGFNPVYTALDAEYIDAGAEAYDVAESGDTVNITDRLEVSNNVNTSIEGEYQVKYNVSDESGNRADEQIRTVYVVLGKK